MLSQFDLAAVVVALGQEFVRRGMHPHAAKLRAFYRELRCRKSTRGAWDESMVIDWAGMLKIPPFEFLYTQRESGAKCVSCRRRPGGPSLVDTRTVFPGGHVSKCRGCGDEWLVEDSPKP
jgi:hypothetical protein